jgi:hypothetical protein
LYAHDLHAEKRYSPLWRSVFCYDVLNDAEIRRQLAFEDKHIDSGRSRLQQHLASDTGICPRRFQHHDAPP